MASKQIRLCRQPIVQPVLRILFHCLRVFQADFRRLALAFGIQQPIVLGRDLKDDFAMRVVEGKIRHQQIRLGQVDGTASSAEIEDQILDMQRGFKDPKRLPVEEFSDQRCLTDRGSQSNAAIVG